jgi:hypothetical protein
MENTAEKTVVAGIRKSMRNALIAQNADQETIKKIFLSEKPFDVAVAEGFTFTGDTSKYETLTGQTRVIFGVQRSSNGSVKRFAEIRELAQVTNDPRIDRITYLENQIKENCEKIAGLKAVNGDMIAESIRLQKEILADSPELEKKAERVKIADEIRTDLEQQMRAEMESEKERIRAEIRAELMAEMNTGKKKK